MCLFRIFLIIELYLAVVGLILQVNYNKPLQGNFYLHHRCIKICDLDTVAQRAQFFYSHIKQLKNLLIQCWTLKKKIDHYLLIGIHDWISFNFNDTSAELGKFLANSVNGKTLWHLTWQNAHINPWVSSRFLILKKFHVILLILSFAIQVSQFLYFYVVS